MEYAGIVWHNLIRHGETREALEERIKSTFYASHMDFADTLVIVEYQKGRRTMRVIGAPYRDFGEILAKGVKNSIVVSPIDCVGSHRNNISISRELDNPHKDNKLRKQEIKIPIKDIYSFKTIKMGLYGLDDSVLDHTYIK